MEERIKDLSVFMTAPDGQNLVIVRVDTNQPGLYGIGCASFAYRAEAVKRVLEDLRPLLIGRETSRVEELWKLMTENAYWRNGPVLNSAAAGVDMALWDIKAKLAGMPLYDLLGGRMRERVDVYRHCNAPDVQRIAALAEQVAADGCRVIRAAYTTFDGQGGDDGYICLKRDCTHYSPAKYADATIKLMETLRARFGNKIELIADMHERLEPADAVRLIKELEPLRLYFVEDPVSPENIAWLERIRACCTTPIAVGEVFSHPSEWKTVIQNRWVDYIRCHISAVGGLTPARKIAVLSELNGVRTAWHGPLDMSPVALAVQTHLDYAAPSFGIQEYYGFSEAAAEVFPGAPVCRDGALWLNDKPGHGVEFDEKAAARFPPKEGATRWTEMRLPDGALHTP